MNFRPIVRERTRDWWYGSGRVKYETSANVARRQVNETSLRIGITVQPTFVSQDWNKLSRQSQQSRQSFVNNGWLIPFHDTCATRIMLAALPEFFTHAFSNTRTQQLANKVLKPMGAYVIWKKINFGSFANAVQSLNSLCARCSLPTNAIHVSTQWPILSVRNSIIKNILTHLFAFAFNQVLSFAVLLNIFWQP